MHVPTAPVELESLPAGAKSNIEVASVSTSVVLEDIPHHALVEDVTRRETLMLFIICNENKARRVRIDRHQFYRDRYFIEPQREHQESWV